MPWLNQSHKQFLKPDEGLKFKKNSLEGAAIGNGKKRFYARKKLRRPPGAKFCILKNICLILLDWMYVLSFFIFAIPMQTSFFAWGWFQGKNSLYSNISYNPYDVWFKRIKFQQSHLHIAVFQEGSHIEQSSQLTVRETSKTISLDYKKKARKKTYWLVNLRCNYPLLFLTLVKKHHHYLI